MIQFAKGWGDLLEVSTDASTLEKTHDEWLATAEKAIKDLVKAGIWVRKVDVDVEELITWCRSRSLPVDAAARSEFVADKQRRADQAR